MERMSLSTGGMTFVGRSPPFVLGGIQLSGLPWSLVQARRRPCSALLCTGQPFHPAPRRPRDFSFIALDEAGLVSVLLPAVSSYVSRRRASCSRGRNFPRRSPWPTHRLPSLWKGPYPELNVSSFLRAKLGEEAPLYLNSLGLGRGFAVFLQRVMVEGQESGPHL